MDNGRKKIGDIPDAEEAGRMTAQDVDIIKRVVNKNIEEGNNIFRLKHARQECKMDVPIPRLRHGYPYIDPKFIIDGVIPSKKTTSLITCYWKFLGRNSSKSLNN
jgi:hypothetical protein